MMNDTRDFSPRDLQAEAWAARIVKQRERTFADVRTMLLRLARSGEAAEITVEIPGEEYLTMERPGGTFTFSLPEGPPQEDGT